MPHQCTNCGRAFDDGSKEMLGGCPDCGGNKFQFRPAGVAHASTDVDGDEAAGGDGQPEEPAGPADSGSPPDGDIIEAPAEPIDGLSGPLEDRAQAAARRSVVADEELPPVEAPPAADEPEAPGLAELRRELNEQFESIKILRPGEYELNLMELYDREECIIALEEDGRYVIDVPDTWRESS